MSKSVMRSCKPYWLYLIIQGVKIIEICKSKPIAKDWDKTVYLYCSQDKKSFNRIPQEDREWFNRFLGKVVCEFVCDGIMRMDAIFMSCNIKYHCVQADELYKYCNGKPLHGWKISKLKIYDEPKELSEFGISRPPQSWCYCEELEENENEAADDYKVLIDYLKSNKIDFKCKSIFTENDCICIPSCDNMSISFHRCNRFFELWTVGITNIFYEDVLDDSTCAKVINIINNYKRLKQARVDYDNARSNYSTFVHNIIYNISDMKANENDK